MEPIRSEIEGKSMIKRRLCNKSVLVVLDDVDDLEQLEALAESHDWFGEGSRIIITTRDEHLLSRKADAIYEVSLLSHDEAIKLFTRHAYRKDRPIEDYERLSLDVVSYAGGLPLALEILGSFLYDKANDEWMSALAKLKSIPKFKVIDRLKISYDGLEHDEKELFLDIACFLRRWEIDEAMTVLDACSFYPGIGVKVLVQKCLIRLSDGRFDMHDLVEEMAHYIVREKHHNHPEKHSRIWQEKDIVDISIMTAKTLMENNHTEVLGLGRSSEPRLRRDVVANTKNLPDVVANMKTLRWIYWDTYPASSLPANFQPTTLGCLMLRWGRQKQLWQGCKHLPNLKLIDLSYSGLLKRTPNFTGLPCLERLILKRCKSLEKIHPSIGYHERLIYVDMSHCPKLKRFPPIICMKKLETLNLSNCFKLQKFPDIRTNMDSLLKLDLKETQIDIIPASVDQFCTNLVYFNASKCRKLKKIEADFRLLKSLKLLRIDWGVRSTWDFFDMECCLEVLSLSVKYEDSTFFKNLMKHIRLQYFHQDVSLKFPQFPRFLRELDLSRCHLGDGDIPSDLSDLLNLQVLDLSYNNFSRLPSSLSRIPGLKFLNLSSCVYLIELPDLPISIAILNAHYCPSLKSLGDLSKYKWLWKVSLWECRKLIGGERVLLHSILEGKALEDCFMSVTLPFRQTNITYFSTSSKITLQLPHNWCSDFSGFLFCLDNHYAGSPCVIVIKQEMSTNTEPDHDQQWKEYDKNDHEFYYEHSQVGYVPFASLRHNAGWNSAYSKVSFQIRALGKAKVLLVPRKSKTIDSSEGAKATTGCSEFWDKEREGIKTFKIIGDSKSSTIKIVWEHSMFYR